MIWIDSHCHLNHERTAEGDTPEAIVTRAKAEGVQGMLSICCEIATEFSTLLSTVKPLLNVWCSVGTHPHESGLDAEKAVTLEQLAALANSDDKVIGIGGSGLDFYYNRSSKEDQENSFRKHISASMETGLPLIVHARDADEDIMRIIMEEKSGSGTLKGVLHCFSSGPLLAEKALGEGFFISFSGIITFKKSKELQEILKAVPLNRLLVETDAPFLAPEPFRGKTNEPAFVTRTGAYIADFLQMDETTIATHTTSNFLTLFDKAKKTWTAN